MSESNGQQLPPGWTWASFEETCETASDSGRKVPEKAYLKAGKFPVVDQGEGLIGGYTDDHDKLFLGNTPIIVFGDHTRRFKFVDFPFAVGADGVKLISASPAWEAKCLWFFLQALKFEDRGYSRHFQFLRNASLPLPPLNEQRRIVDTLEELSSDIDAGVAALERVQAKLAQYRAAVLKAAVEGALTADWRKKHREVEPASALLARILAERRRRWEQDQLRKFKQAGKEPPKDWKAKYKEPVAPDTTTLLPLPEGWCWATLDQLAWACGYGTSVKCREANTGLAVLRIPNIIRGKLELENLKYAPVEYSEDAEELVKAGDLLVVRTNGSRNLIGRGAVLRDNLKAKLSFASYLIRLRLIPMAGLLSWVSLAWDGFHVRRWIESHAATSAGQYNISLGILQTLAVPLPPLAEQEAIVESVEDQLSVVEHLEADVAAKLKSAQALRQAILRQAFTGRLVPQDPNDEPASELLKRIDAERKERARQTAAAKQAAKPKRKAHRP
jgi:type I restriction enzyme S subunit